MNTGKYATPEDFRRWEIAAKRASFNELCIMMQSAFAASRNFDTSDPILAGRYADEGMTYGDELNRRRNETRYVLFFSYWSAPLKSWQPNRMQGMTASDIGQMITEKAAHIEGGTWRMDGIQLDPRNADREAAMAGYVATFGTASE